MGIKKISESKHLITGEVVDNDEEKSNEALPLSSKKPFKVAVTVVLVSETFLVVSQNGTSRTLQMTDEYKTAKSGSTIYLSGE